MSKRTKEQGRIELPSLRPVSTMLLHMDEMRGEDGSNVLQAGIRVTEVHPWFRLNHLPPRTGRPEFAI